MPCHEISPHLGILRARQQHLVTKNSDSSRTNVIHYRIEIISSHYNTYTMDSPPSDLSPENESVRGRSQGQRKRIRVWTEDDRAKHRVFEKNRREAFSDSLMALARFLPSLASTKESKLSKHTIVDESLKYHELQQNKLDELQRNFDALTAENEGLLAEVSGWRQCLDVQPPQTVPAEAAELCEPSILQTTRPCTIVDDPDLLYGDMTAPGCDRPLAVPEMANVPGSNPIPADFFDDYATQPSQTRFQDDPSALNIPVATQHFIQDDYHIQQPHTNPWPPLQAASRPQQTAWENSSFHDIPLEFH